MIDYEFAMVCSCGSFLDAATKSWLEDLNIEI